MKRMKATGFVNWVKYEIKDKGSEWDSITCMLAKHAEFEHWRKQNRSIRSVEAC
jgi:hypothetical protein